MDVEPRSEEEQVAFFESIHARYLEAARAVGEIEHVIRVAGTTVRLRFAGERLVPQIMPALEHLRADPGAGPEVTFCLWDSESTAVAMPPAPCEKSCFTDRGDIWGFASARIRTAFHYYDFSVNLLDLDRRVAVYWVNGLSSLPYWSRSSPLRTLFHWWLEEHGAQLVHAAAVATAGGALLLTGKGGAGKSTTALACLRAGFDYLADDYVIVQLEPEPTVHCLYATAKVDGDRAGWFPELADQVVNPDRLGDEKAVIQLHPALGRRLRPTAPLRAILLPRIRDGVPTALVEAEPEEVLHAARFTTMSQLPCAGRRTHDNLGRLCATLPGYTLELGRDLAAIPAVVGRATSRERPAPGIRRRGAGSTRVEPLISVVIPVYNGQAFLREAVDSVVGQGYQNLEILIVDDGSTDRTPDVIAELAVDVRSFTQPNSGAAAARNRGIREAAAELVAFLDVDDLWPEGSLRMLMRHLAEHPELDLVRGWAQVMVHEPSTDTYEHRGCPTESFPDYIGAALYRKRVFARVGLFDRTLQFAEDVDWYNRARELGIPMQRLDAVTLHVRRHGRNMTHGRTLQELNMLKAFKKHLDRRRAAPGGRARDGDR